MDPEEGRLLAATPETFYVFLLYTMGKWAFVEVDRAT